MTPTAPAVFGRTVTALPELRVLIGEPRDLALRKQIDRLDDHCRAFIAHAPFVLLATAGADGRCDVSPKGDPAGFVLVLDDRHLLVPDRVGNRRLDGMQNLLVNPHVGLLFMVPGVEETLRVNGRGFIVAEPALLARMAVGDRVPTLAVGVEVQEVYLHCAKALRRSGLWEPARWPDRAGVPAAACMFRDHARVTDLTVEELEARLQDGYRTRLY